jgi:hypothetical protein
MTRGDSSAVTAAVTLDQSTPPTRVLHRPGAVAEPGVVVSCLIRAQMTASKDDFDVDHTGWVERSLLTTDTARWSWYVTPKIGGTHTLVLSVQPIVAMRSKRGIGQALASTTSDIGQYETRVHVNVPWSERPQEIMSRLAETFNVAEGMVKALTALVVAIIGLLAALGIRRKRDRAKPSVTSAGEAGTRASSD